MKGYIYSIQRYCIHDGPGIRTNVFFKGCQLHCPWCANPESQDVKKEIGFIAHKCIGCGTCVKKCPVGALDKNNIGRIDRGKCILCGACVRYCASECYQIFGREIGLEELLNEIEKDLPFYRNTGGGVTVTGGEPTLQHEFLEQFLKKCKANGINTAIETHGIVEHRILMKLAPYIDYFLIDVKCMDPSLHKKITGMSNEATLNNIRLLTKNMKKKVALRIPCIPGFNMNKENMDKLIEFAKEIQQTGNLSMINLLPYHNLGQSKYEMLQKEYLYCSIPTLKDDMLTEYEIRIKNEKLPVRIGG